VLGVGEALFEGIGQPTAQVTVPGGYGFDPALNETYPYDPAKAKSLLAGAGYPNGFPLRMATPQYQQLNLIAQALKQQWKQVGVDLQITTQRRRMAYDGSARDVASATSRVHLRPNDTAAVELPKSVYESDPFLGHELSLRIQSREIRGAAGVQSTSVFVAPPGKREE